MRGLIKEMLSLLGWIVSFVVANAYGAALAKLLPDMIPGNAIRMIIGFIALFIAVRLLMQLVILAMQAMINATGLTMADRGLGGLFGLARGIVLVLAAVLVCGMTSIPKQDFWKNALLSPIAEAAARTVKPYLPGSVAQHVEF